MEDDNLNIKFHTGKKEIHNIKMSEVEKTRILQNILNSPIDTQPIKSPYSIPSVFTVLYKKSFTYYYAVLPVLTFFLVGGIALASGGSLPGNILYPVKVNIVEPIHSALLFSSKEKAYYESSLAVDRLIEAETLLDQDSLDQLNETRLTQLLSKHTSNLNKALGEIYADPLGDSEAGDDIAINFQAGMKAHAQILDILDEDTDKKNESQEDKRISNNARTNGDSIRNSFKSNEDKSDASQNENTSTKYTKKRTSVQSIIDSTSSDISLDTESNSNSKKRIFTDTNETLDQARNFLKEADEEDHNGNSKNAYSKLLDSESSAKEASIFLRTGLGLHGNKHD